MRSKQTDKARVAICALTVFAGVFVACPLVSGQVEHNVPEIAKVANDLGPIDPLRVGSVTVHLSKRNRAAFDAAVEDLYNPESSHYRQWMSDAELKQYAPSEAALTSVKQELSKHGLTIVSVDPVGFSIRARGTTAQLESAFQTTLHTFEHKGVQFEANIADARLTGAAGDLVSGISGLERHQVRPLAFRAKNLGGNKPLPSFPLKSLATGTGLSGLISDVCFGPAQTLTLSSTGTPNSLPTAVYFGNVYEPTTKICDFTASDLEAYYGLKQAYKAGYTGKGQTVVLLEAYGYPTMLEDANAFSQLMGLPTLTASTFQVIYPEGAPLNPNAGTLTGWDTEIAMDIQWAHAMAPDANIAVVAAAGQDSEDFEDAMKYIINNKVGYAVSDSWETDNEEIAGTAELNDFNDVLEEGAAKGVSFQFSTGDSGTQGFGTQGAIGVPSDCPYATAVGGTSILQGTNGISSELGWGTYVTALGSAGYPQEFPFDLGFQGGAGGGEGVYFKKPSWQANVPGTYRSVPDIAALADGNTGVPIVLSIQGSQEVEPGWGGTSLASPIVTAIWALGQQKAGHPLGQIAPAAASMSRKAVRDIVPMGSATNVAGIIFDVGGPTSYATWQILGLPPEVEPFISGLVNQSGSWYDISFGTDLPLTTGIGWDNVTGFGVPSGLNFITEAAADK